MINCRSVDNGRYLLDIGPVQTSRAQECHSVLMIEAPPWFHILGDMRTQGLPFWSNLIDDGDFHSFCIISLNTIDALLYLLGMVKHQIIKEVQPLTSSATVVTISSDDSTRCTSKDGTMHRSSLRTAYSFCSLFVVHISKIIPPVATNENSHGHQRFIIDVNVFWH